MPRPPKIWRRKGRSGWWATISGRQVHLGESRPEAEREFHRLRGTAPQDRESSRVTVHQLADEYLAWVQSRVKLRTFKNYRDYLQSWTNHAGRLLAARVKVEHVHRWLDANPSWGSSSTHLALTVLRLWASWCDERGHALSPIIKKVKKPPILRRKPPPPGALEAILEAFVCPQFRDFVTVLWEIGCRPGELSSLEADRIFWDSGTALLRGKTGERLVGLTPNALEILHKAAQNFPQGQVLRNSRGEPWTEGAIRAQFLRARRRSGVSGVVSYHLRHAFWARASKVGLSDILIARQLGHSNLNMLNRHYAEVTPEMLHDAATKASQPARDD